MPKFRRVAALGGAASLATVGALAFAAPAHAETAVDRPDEFTSAFTVMATPDQVINNDGVATPGTAGATGTFDFQINSDLDIICYDITVEGLSGDYQSPAKTATHIHQAVAGQAGPPRIAFPNPAPIGDGPRTSSGCLQGPFTTGVVTNGADTGQGFELSAIEADPSSFFSDTHTVANPAGAVRGQLTQVPVGGVATGGGATAAASTTDDTLAAAGVGAGLLGLVALGAVAVRRRVRSSAE
jgi:hypothetical protein